MENLSQEIRNLKVSIKNLEEEKKQLNAVIHIVTLHCCNLIGEKEGKSIDDVHKEINEIVNKIINGSR